jgi:ferredoxin
MGLFKGSARDTAPAKLRLDPVACDGVGMCAHLAPSLVRLDSWGYPLMPGHALSNRDEREARRAVSGCPRRALFVEQGAAAAS